MSPLRLLAGKGASPITLQLLVILKLPELSMQCWEFWWDLGILVGDVCPRYHFLFECPRKSALRWTMRMINSPPKLDLRARSRVLG